MYVYIHIHTYIRTYIHTCVCISADPSSGGVTACGIFLSEIPLLDCHAITPPYLPVEAKTYHPGGGGGGGGPVYPGVPGLPGGVRGHTGVVWETPAPKFPSEFHCSRWNDCNS